ncbi:thioredoxin reductase (NADPH) [Dethiosulfatibacter aminovorans DSM 17477]|uniref:Thioredoxin reductase (NADPH) n=1 Tax=Dethiosulfatibacter aminovorans DSM 17477 TaxID=1121476 RepID=A0A1M6K442_9FIRM|nr:FAD-dependent oxidoreductase [Dethiosulfatibacter aminovorans]SHJ53743.1 thioredoxin reductase (NADPH) [Dethiosulfatibacter aminovorans DSM 17477]
MAREKKVEYYDVVVIGAGAAGLTAAIYSARARLNTLIMEKALVGGLATYTNEIENYPGFPNSPKGEEITDEMKAQAKKMGVKFKLTEVQKVELEGEEKVVETFRNKFIAKSVILATGGRPRITKAKNEEDYLFDKGISFCATCDAAANTDKTVVVIGSGDAAIEEGMFLTKFAKKVIVSVMHDEGTMDCNEIAKEAALANPKMEFIWNTVVESFEGEGHLDTVVLKDLKANKLVPVKCDNCFEFIGYVPNTEIFKEQIDLTPQGYILTNDRMETNIEGVFACGDVREKWLKQVATAVGDGAIAGFAAEKYIAESEVFEQTIMKKDKNGAIYVYNAIEADQRELLPLIEEMTEKHRADFNFCKIDVYKSDGLAKRLGRTEYPYVAIVKDGQVAEYVTEVNEDAIMAAIK